MYNKGIEGHIKIMLTIIIVVTNSSQMCIANNILIVYNDVSLISFK